MALTHARRRAVALISQPSSKDRETAIYFNQSLLLWRLGS